MNHKKNNILLKKRDSNIELLRIIAMVMIVAHHFSVHGNFQPDSTTFINNIWLEILFSGGKIGVNIFIMISGYYLIDSQKIKINKILKMLFQMLFYSLIIFTLFVLFDLEPFSVKSLFNHFLCYPLWWFASCYLALYLIHPYINKLLNNLGKKSYQKLLIYSTIIWCVIPTLTNESFDSGFLIWFIYIYCLGGYLNRFPLKLDWTAKKYFLISLIMYFITFFIKILFGNILKDSTFLFEYINRLFDLETLSTLLISLFLFIGFSKLKIKYSKLINTISSTTFGIYLIHDYEYARPFLWQTVFKNSNYSDRLMLMPYSIMVITFVFIGCFLIEFLRIYILEKRYLKLIDKLSLYLNKLVNKIFNFDFFNKI